MAKKRELTKKQLVAEITKYTKAIAAHRDALRDIVNEANEILSDTSEAADELESAIEILSRNL